MTASIADLAGQRPPFASLLRQLRQARRLSQLGLSLESEVAQRHISFLESGRARPGRDVVLKLSRALDLSLRATNGLLHAAGLPAEAAETPIDDPSLGLARDALRLLLARIDPNPAIVVDPAWTVHDFNQGAGRLIAEIARPDALLRASAGRAGPNLIALLEDEAGLRVPMPDRAEVLAHLRGEPLAAPGGNGQPFLPARFTTAAGPLSFLTILGGLGGPRDVTLQELRVEIFFPADDATRTWLAGG
ncbi:helix-turn-helix transcriptional regulator [Zavarzinia compransoris]|uniref:helix-turn-helix domain-containing protein n=1 Tax=Zavarzinia marina TaxID=2911065 RepID=UPI001F46F72C|nr:helix-turn-helix domain-containing protein [Zavarzinia marina]MCF4164409.1 helix-turn-helix transcriptional regulator [Zavarzinia marina]